MQTLPVHASVHATVRFALAAPRWPDEWQYVLLHDPVVSVVVNDPRAAMDTVVTRSTWFVAGVVSGAFVPAATVLAWQSPQK